MPGEALKLVTPAALDPVTLAKAKSRLRAFGTAEDADITDLIAEVTQQVQGETGKQFINATFRLVLDSFPCGRDKTIRFPLAPVSAVASVTYYDSDGELQTLDESAYHLAASGVPARLVPASGIAWPGTMERPEAVAITFTAGYGATVADVPREAIAAIHEILAHRWKHRGDEAAADIPPTAKRMLQALDVRGFN